jgi:hypothetical protein
MNIPPESLYATLALLFLGIGIRLIDKVSRKLYSKRPPLLEDPSQLRDLRSYDHRNILRNLLSMNPQGLSCGRIAAIPAHCDPQEAAVWGEDSHSSFRFWILQLDPSCTEDRLLRCAFAAARYAPNRYDTIQQRRAAQGCFKGLERPGSVPRKIRSAVQRLVSARARNGIII